MSDCREELKRTVPLYKAVSAAIVDSFEDIGKVQQIFSHWGARKLKELNRQTLKTNKKKVTLTINQNTKTATLPIDFGTECFVGLIINGRKVPLPLRQDLVDTKNIDDISCEDKCPKCNQDKAVCNDLTITEDTVLVNINNVIYEQTIIKKLYPDGSYYLETRIPVLDIEESEVVYTTTKELITKLDLKPCGCIDDTEQNIEKIKCCCYDVYCKYYAPCDGCCTDYGGYNIFEETGLIKFDGTGFTKVYIEYYGIMPKKNGQYHIPEVAFETIVEWIKFRNVDGKRSVPNVDKQWRYSLYQVARKNMEKEMGRFSLNRILEGIYSTPKFDIGSCGCDYWLSDNCYSPVRTITSTPASCLQAPACAPATVPVYVGVNNSSNPNPSNIAVQFGIAVIAGMGQGYPVAGTNTYQLDALIGAVGLNFIIVNNTIETIKALQFTLNSVTGTISRWQGDGVTPNNWADGDVLVANFTKYVV